MVHLEGAETFALPPAELFSKLTNAHFLVKSIPDAEVVEANPDRAVWKLRPRLSFLSGSLDLTLSVTARTPPTTARYTVLGKGVGATSTVEATLNFDSAGTGTKVAWTGDITALTGLLKLVPKGLIQATASKIIADIWAAIHAQLGEDGGPDAKK